MIQTQTYVRKPLYVKAVQVTSENFNEIALWCQGEIQEIVERGRSFQFISVRVTNPMNPRQGQARVGDWILTSERGYKVYTPKAFENAFDLAPAVTDPAALRAEAKDGQLKPEEAEMIAVATEPIVNESAPVGSGPMPEQPEPTDAEPTTQDLPPQLSENPEIVFDPNPPNTFVVTENTIPPHDPNVVYPSSPETTV